MSRHEGVSCDACMKANFKGRRFKCLICYDYDLCSVCYEVGSTTSNHTAEHPMQCILTKADFDTYHFGETLCDELPQSFTCPYCGKMGYTESTLQEHVTANHTDVSYEVVCPICASHAGGDPNHVTDDFADHLAVDHTAARNAGTDGIQRGGMRRMPHQGRGINRGVSRQSMRFGDSMDPIAELLSQLSGVRRSAPGEFSPSSIHLHQEARMRRQMQLYRMEPSNTTSGFVNTTGTAVSKSKINSATTTSSELVTGTWTQVNQAAQRGAVSSNISNVVPSYTTTTQPAAASSSKMSGQPSFLLSRLLELEKGEECSDISSEKAAYVQELMLSTLCEFSIETQEPIEELMANFNLRDSDDTIELNTVTTTSEAGTQTDVLVSPTQVSSGGFPMTKNLAHTVLKNKSTARVNRSSPRLQSPNDPTLSHGRIVTGSGTVSVPAHVGRGRISSSEPLSPGINRRKPVRGDGRAQPPPN